MPLGDPDKLAESLGVHPLSVQARIVRLAVEYDACSTEADREAVRNEFTIVRQNVIDFFCFSIRAFQSSDPDGFSCLVRELFAKDIAFLVDRELRKRETK